MEGVKPGAMEVVGELFNSVGNIPNIGDICEKLNSFTEPQMYEFLNMSVQFAHKSAKGRNILQKTGKTTEFSAAVQSHEGLKHVFSVANEVARQLDERFVNADVVDKGQMQKAYQLFVSLLFFNYVSMDTFQWFLTLKDE